MWVPLLLLLLAVGAPADAKKKEEAVIEEVGAKQLEQLVEQHDYVAVFWYGRRCKIDCDAVLTELETIDDDTDKFGVQFVKINDKKLAKKYGISEFPALTYFRNKEPIKYEGDLMNEDEVLEFLTSLDAMELPDQIEEVNAKILDKIVEEQPYVAVFFCPSVESCRLSEYKSSCRKCERALKELENIDDEADQLGIAFVKINDEALADEYSLDSLPTLVYYRNRIPIVYDGDLTKEEDVLDWLVQNKSTGDDDDEIEDVSETMLEAMIDSVDYLAVLFYQEDDEDSEAALAELENIDDECDDRGIHFVKTDDEDAARSYGIEEFPTLVYFEKEIPNIYDGDLTDEDEVLAWLIHQLESDEIEDVTDEMLDKLIKEESHVAVLFYDENDKKSQRVLVELENIDDECDKNRIVFVKIDNDDEAKEYGIEETPTLVYFEDGVPSVYDGDLMKEEEVLAWLLDQVENEMIEDVTDEMLDKLIDGTGHLAALFSEHDDVTVLFYDKGQKKSQKVLVELENIDDECDEHGIVFVKIDNTEEAIEYGIEQLPTLVYFENEIPSIYDGDLMNEEEVLAWLVRQVSSDEIEDVTDEMLDKIIERNPYVAAVFWDDKDDKQDLNTLVELENIDDECDKHGIVFVKIDNDEEAKEYGIEELPTLVYFENQIPSIYEGDLNDENQVLEWLVEQKESSTIEEVTDEILDDLVKDHGYVAVYYIGGPCKKGDQCSRLLDELENIDDETDEHGIIFVTTEDTGFAKSSAGIKKFPALVLYKNGHPLAYPGKIADEEAVLKWLTDDKTLELPDQIEEVNGRMLKKFIDDDSDDVVAFFYKKKDKNADAILAELEHIDDDTERAGITFVKCSDSLAAKQYQVTRPAIVFFHNDKPVFYKGDLKDEDKLLEWLMEMKDTVADDVIEEVKGAQLQKMVDELDYLVVFFYDDKCKNCDAILAELENIDDEADDAGIHFVKTMDTAFAKSLGIHTFPTVVYFEDSVPIVYNGELTDENSVLDWAIKVKDDDSIEEIDRPTLLSLIDSEDYLAVYFYVDNSESSSVLKYMEMIDDEAAEYGIRFVKINDKLMAKKYGFRDPPGLAYFRKGKHIKFDGDLYDEEEILDWLTNPDNMELTDAIEKINRKMFARLVERTDHYFAVFFYTEKNCKQCEKVLQELEHIDDEAGAAGIDFVKIDDMELARQYGVFALPAVVLFRGDEADPVIYAGDLKNEERILEWLLVEKNPGSEVIEELSGQELQKQIDISDAIAVYFYNDSCADCAIILQELENIDDDTDRHGIKFVKTQDMEMANSFGVTEFPALIYFEKQTPSVFEGDLRAEEDVLQWLVLQKTEDRIETVNRGVLEQMLEDTQYLAVFFYKPNCKACDVALSELETIDDECDLYGIHMVKIQDPQLAKRYGIKTLPALVYFRNGNPLIYEGDPRNAAGVLEWLLDDENRELVGEIEEINARMLERLLDESPFVAVFFYDEECSDCGAILEELENIDDEADMYGIDFVKISDEEAAQKYHILHTPALVYFRKRIPIIYEGDMTDDEKVLSWLTSQDVLEIKDEIEEVNRKMLDKLLDENDFVAVYFYENDCPRCDEVLTELETIDDEADNLDITFVKIRDTRYAKKYGISKLPAMVYFRRRFPSIYRGDLLNETEVLDWLQKNRYKHPELNLFMYAIGAVSVAFVGYTTFLVFCFHGNQQKAA
ncbi:uncharacterized protein LOC122391084 isoform X20 [Amphibalanus amphitrite]|uniref:uncharacterized protein LOC122391084 isoform X20 n=1 Tax=Amphibalanus amphitrite TaxID=1232801 RepID=UPI001C91DC32|nr:uncharacterized protein LOC122391084 isoform X20 [Amphibalanus amphitrite]